MDPSRFIIVVLVLIFIFLLPDIESPSRTEEHELDRLLVERDSALLLLSSTSYGALDVEKNRWINITGFRHQDGYAWNLLPLVQKRAAEQLQAVLDGTPLSPLDLQSTSNDAGEVPRSLNGSSMPGDLWGHQSSVYQNVTGIVHGQWTRSRIASQLMSPLNLTTLAPHITYITKAYNRNITGRDGDLRIKLNEKNSFMLESEHGLVREVHAELAIKDQASTGDGWEMTLHGVHFPKQGRIILTTTGQRFPGIFALPHFARSNDEYLSIQKLLNQTLNAILKRQELSLNNPYFAHWSSSPNNPTAHLFPSPNCEYIVYLQQHPVVFSHTELKAIEDELRFPTGAPMPVTPSIKLSALIFSPDCGFVLESKGPPDFTSQERLHLVGQKLELYIRLARRGVLAFALVLFAEASLLIRQMKDTSTPSTRSRVSFYTIAMMAFGDGFAFLGLMAVVVSTDAAFLPLTATGFLSFLCVGVFGMKFMMDVWAVQAPERLDQDRRSTMVNPATTTAPTTTPSTIITAAGADTLPLPASARRASDNGPADVILPSDQDTGAAAAENATAAQTGRRNTQNEMGVIYSQFYFLLFSVSFLSLHATSWPTTARSIYMNTLVFGYLSLWVPQIYRNIIRNCRQALRWEFVIGQSLLRLAPFVYIYTVEDNILFVKTDQNAAFALIGWVWIQTWALVSQEVLGPRFFVPNGWAPPAYDYHPILREDDQEAGVSMPIGFAQGLAETSSAARHGEIAREGKWVFDCAICMQNLEVPVVRSQDDNGDGNGSVTNMLFARRAYMVTPCRHIFHSPCLEGWMRYRLQCPICRDNLPPL